MKISATTMLAFKSLFRHAGRSALTTLGIVIGIAAVIAMMEIGQGSSSAIKEIIAKAGTATISIRPGSFDAAAVRQASGSRMSLKYEDAESIKNDCPSVKWATPIVYGWRFQAAYGNRNWQPRSTVGGNEDYLKMRSWEVTSGRDFNADDILEAASVCIVGKTVVEELFDPAENPVDKSIKLKGQNFKVIGVLEEKGVSMFGQDQDDLVVLPWTTLRRRLAGTNSSVSVTATTSGSSSTNSIYPSGGVSFYPGMSSTQRKNTMVVPRFSYIDEIVVSAVTQDQVDQAIEEIRILLRDRHRIAPGKRDDFSIENYAEGIKVMTGVSELMSNLLMGVALISLVVGGVGIMNIMLVSVTERTREIGLRMSVGARSFDILQQFLTEAVVLCLFGGIIGIAAGHGGGWLFHRFLDFPVEGSFMVVVAAVGVSVAVGVIFGFYPAFKASRLDPIEALRYE